MVESKPSFIRLQIDRIFGCAIKFGLVMYRFVLDKFFVTGISSSFRKLTANLVKVMVALASFDALKSRAKCHFISLGNFSVVSPINYAITNSRRV